MSSPEELQSDSQQSKKSFNGTEDLQDLDFTINSRWTDFQLKVEGKDLYVPKSHLALLSPVFRKMFEFEFKEKDLTVLPLPDKKHEDVLTFLKCTHPGTRLKVTYDAVPKVLPLAHEYQVKWLLDDCTNVMMMEMDASKYSATFRKNYRDTSTDALVTKFCNICIMAEKYGLRSVIERFIEIFASINHAFYKNVPAFNEISIDVRYRIVNGRLASKDDRLKPSDCEVMDY